jgi:hypothetical protein
MEERGSKGRERRLREARGFSGERDERRQGLRMDG